MNIKRNSWYKSRGSILVITALAAIVWIFIAQSLFIVGAGGFGMIKSSRVALQAQQYAEIEVDRLKNVAYENLDSDGAHSRQAIANIQESGWEDEVSIGSEHSISGSDNAKQRIATVNVYKSGDTLPRFTLEVPLSSQSGSSNTKSFEDDFVDIRPNLNGIAEKSGILVAGGSNKPNNLEIYVNGKLVGFVTRRGYGTGTISTAVPINKGDAYSIRGYVYFAYIRYFR